MPQLPDGWADYQPAENLPQAKQNSIIDLVDVLHTAQCALLIAPCGLVAMTQGFKASLTMIL